MCARRPTTSGEGGLVLVAKQRLEGSGSAAERGPGSSRLPMTRICPIRVSASKGLWCGGFWGGPTGVHRGVLMRARNTWRDQTVPELLSSAGQIVSGNPDQLTYRPHVARQRQALNHPTSAPATDRLQSTSLPTRHPPVLQID
jgi:hypothetical protein